MMQCNIAGKALIKSCEGLRLEPYLDTGGVWTVGYGTTKIADIPVCSATGICEEQANLYFNRDLSKVENDLNNLIKLPLSDNQFSALCCFVYNIGISAFKKSTMLKKINLKDFDGAALEFDRWVFDNGKKIKGLVARRKKEKELFLRP